MCTIPPHSFARALLWQFLLTTFHSLEFLIFLLDATKIIKDFLTHLEDRDQK